MQTHYQPFDLLVSAFFDYLRKNQRSEKTIKTYDWVFRKVKAYMDLNNIQCYDQEAERRFLVSHLGTFNPDGLSAAKKVFVHQVKVLTEFQVTGTIVMGTKKQPPKVFDGPIGDSMLGFIKYKQTTYQVADSTIKGYNTDLHNLLTFLHQEKVVSLEQLTTTVILGYIASLDPSKRPTMNRLLLITKNYLRYLYEHKYLSTDYSGSVPKGKPVLQRQLPSTFSIEEIKTLLASIDRSNAVGRRDYAILLLATKLGMRSSDIRGLKFDHILWQQNMIVFDQQKTGKSISLPLLAEIGNALIVYLKHGRPVSNEPYVFVQIRFPYKRLDRTAIGSSVYFHLKRAGINCLNRKHGPHALRHSFAGALLKKKTPIAVISEALGHRNSNTTMNYLRIDADTLRQCALDVPEVPSSFYSQKEGGCYE
jgi:site-specific recombinase XerD